MRFTREPTLYIQAISALLSIFTAFALDGFSAEQVALIVAVISAVGGVVNAILVDEIAPPVFTGAIGAVAALLAGYGFNVSPEVVGSIQAAAVAVLAVLVRVQVTPTRGT